MVIILCTNLIDELLSIVISCYCLQLYRSPLFSCPVKLPTIMWYCINRSVSVFCLFDDSISGMFCFHFCILKISFCLGMFIWSVPLALFRLCWQSLLKLIWKGFAVLSEGYPFIKYCVKEF